MSYSERWEELFGPADGGPAMSLASTAPPSGARGGANGKLTHSGGPWTSASATAADLRTTTQANRTALARGHEGVEAGAVGLTSVAALKSVLTSWEERLQALRGECEQLTETLRTVAKEMGETETAIEKSFRDAGGSAHRAGEK